MNADVEFHIKHNYAWTKLPGNIRQLLGNSQEEYDRSVFNYSIKNQLVYKGNLVKQVCRDQRKYYESLLVYSRQHLMLYPYHLSEFMIRGLRITPFAYYHGMMKDIMSAEKSYDSLPNFTAADCLRLLGIGRNQYIDLMNATKTNRIVPKFFQMKRKNEKALLPTMPIDNVVIEPWWLVKVSLITDEDVKLCKPEEKQLLDDLISYNDQTSDFRMAGAVDHKALHGLYKKGFVYLDVPIHESDRIIVPPLEGFVMNRVLGDYFETLLYKIFVSLDEHTPIRELANVLEINLQLVQNAISVYCRLGFAKKKYWDKPAEGLHQTWNEASLDRKKEEGDLFLEWDVDDFPLDTDDSESQGRATPIDSMSIDNLAAMATSTDSTAMASGSNTNHSKRVGFLFDSTLTAFLMMGNLSPGLKNHAVTMFEVGKLSDETMDSFISELEKVGSDAEGEAQRYFDHAITLRDTVLFLRHNDKLPSTSGNLLGLDLIRCESLLGLDPQVCRKLLNKNYEILISMAPLSNEIRSISSCVPQHLGPAIPEVSSMWFKLYIYHLTQCGPATLFLPKGSKIRQLPSIFKKYERCQITTWGHDPSILATSNLLLTLQDCLSHSAVLVQTYSISAETGAMRHLSFPLSKDDPMVTHPAVIKLQEHIDLTSTCGYITLLNSNKISEGADASCNIAEIITGESTLTDMNQPSALVERPSSESVDFSDWLLLDCCFGIPLFDANLNKEICGKILEHNLLNTDSLSHLLKSSRELSLELLDFIARHQDLLLTGDSMVEGSMLPNSHKPDQSIPHPTRKLYFNGHIIEAD